MSFHPPSTIPANASYVFLMRSYFNIFLAAVMIWLLSIHLPLYCLQKCVRGFMYLGVSQRPPENLLYFLCWCGLMFTGFLNFFFFELLLVYTLNFMENKSSSGVLIRNVNLNLHTSNAGILLTFQTVYKMYLYGCTWLDVKTKFIIEQHFLKRVSYRDLRFSVVQ